MNSLPNGITLLTCPDPCHAIALRRVGFVLIIPVWVNSALDGAILARLNYQILCRLFDINPHFVGTLWSRHHMKTILRMFWGISSLDDNPDPWIGISTIPPLRLRLRARVECPKGDHRHCIVLNYLKLRHCLQRRFILSSIPRDARVQMYLIV